MKDSYVLAIMCLVTCAVHLKITISFKITDILLALETYISRRGMPQTIYSDRALSLVGITQRLNTNKVEQREMISWLQNYKIQWILIPVDAHHQNGAAELAIKPFRRHLNLAYKGEKFTLIRLYQIVTEI
jgi:hypothetical protein